MPDTRLRPGTVFALAAAALGLTLSTPEAAAQGMAPMSQQSMRPPAVGAVSVPARPATGPFYQAPATAKMSALLAEIYRKTDWRLDPTKPAERAIYYRALLAKQPLSPADDAVVRQQLSKELLYAGDSEAAVNTLEDLRRRWRDAHRALPAEAEQQIGEWLALSYLRLGEQENCAQMHGQTSCLFPLRASAVHQMPRGAAGAVRELSALLTRNPDDAESRWLLNVAYMQLGRYPKDVPARWLLPESNFRSDAPFPEFPEIAASAGIDITSHAGGVVMEDFDGDGRLDIMVTSSGPADQMHLFHNNGDGTFTDITRQAGLTGETGGLNLVVTDYNNDGHPDILILRGGWWGKQGQYPMSLLRNNGVHDGPSGGTVTFDDVTESAGLLSLGPTQTAAWADFDNDGWLDLFVGHESKPDDPHPSQLFHNNHDGTFTEIAGPSGLADLGFVKGVCWGDFNLDGRPDLYISVMNGRDRLFRNDGPASGKPASAAWTFTDVTRTAGVDKHRNSFATWFFDFDNDGWPDLFVGGYSTQSMQDVGLFEAGKPNHAETPRLYHNNHDGTFTDLSHALHLDRAILTMGANFGDLNDDGWPDIYLGTGESSYQALLPNRMFLNDGGKRFLDVTTDGGFGHLQKGHGIAFGDLFNTGHEDVFEEMGGALPGDTYQAALYRNPGNPNHSVTLILEGVQTNRAAFGARIDVTPRTSSNPERHIFRTVGYGSSFGGNPLRQHIGLGPSTEVASIVITWPTSHTTQRFTDLHADQTIRIREGDAHLTSAPYAPHHTPARGAAAEAVAHSH